MRVFKSRGLRFGPLGLLLLLAPSCVGDGEDGSPDVTVVQSAQGATLALEKEVRRCSDR